MATDTFTNLLGFLLMGTGNDNNTWGANLNTSVFQITEDAVAGALVTAAAGGALGPSNILDLSGTPPPAAPSQARWSTLFFTGAITANQTVKVPNLRKWWMVNNQCTGGFTVSMQTPSGSPVVIPTFGFVQVYCDGNNVITVSPISFSQIRMPNGTAAAPVYSYALEPTSGWYRNTTQDIRLSIGGADVLQVTGAGGSPANAFNIVSPLSLYFSGVKFDQSSVVPTGAELYYAGIVPPTGYVFCFGQAVSRASLVNLLAALSATTTGNTHSNTLIDNVPVNLTGLGLEGANIEGTGIGLGNTIVSITATTITVQSAIAGTNTGVALRILPYGQGDGSTTFNVPDRRGRFIAGRDNMGGSAAGNLTNVPTSGILGTKLNATGGEQGHTLSTPEMPAHTHGITDPGHSHTVFGLIVALAPGGSGVIQPNAATSTGDRTPGTSTNTTGITIQSTGGGGAHNNVPPAGISNVIIKT